MLIRRLSRVGAPAPGLSKIPGCRSVPAPGHCPGLRAVCSPTGDPMKLAALAAALVLAGATLAAHAHDYTLGEIRIGHPYARVTTAAQRTGGGYLKLHNQGVDERLLSASAAVA